MCDQERAFSNSSVHQSVPTLLARTAISGDTKKIRSTRESSVQRMLPHNIYTGKRTQIKGWVKKPIPKQIEHEDIDRN